jgi:hypothetical protein
MPPGGGGGWQSGKTTFEGIVSANNQLAKTSQSRLRVKSKGGAPKGNRNAWKHGHCSAPVLAERRAFRARVAEFHGRVARILAQVDEQVARRAGNGGA